MYLFINNCWEESAEICNWLWGQTEKSQSASKFRLSWSTTACVTRTLTSPTLICLCTSRSSCLIWGHSESGTYILEQAEHFCPPYSNAERMVPFTTLWTSADLCTKWKFLPPHSKTSMRNKKSNMHFYIKLLELNSQWHRITNLQKHEGSSCRCPDSGRPASTIVWKCWKGFKTKKHENIDNNTCLLIKSAYYNDFWRSCDTEDWSNNAENSALITEIIDILKYIQIENVSQYYCLYCIFIK